MDSEIQKLVQNLEFPDIQGPAAPQFKDKFHDPRSKFIVIVVIMSQFLTVIGQTTQRVTIEPGAWS